MTIKERLVKILEDIQSQSSSESIVAIIMCKTDFTFTNPFYGYKVANSNRTGIAYILSTNDDGFTQVINTALAVANCNYDGERCED